MHKNDQNLLQKNGDSATAMYRALREGYGPTTQAIGRIVKKFEETGVVTNIEIIVSLVPLKLSLLQVKMLPKTQMCRFLVVLRI